MESPQKVAIEALTYWTPYAELDNSFAGCRSYMRQIAGPSEYVKYDDIKPYLTSHTQGGTNADGLPPLPESKYCADDLADIFTADQMRAYALASIRAASQSGKPDLAADLALMIEHVETLEQGLRDNGCEIVTDEEGNVWVRNVRAELAEKVIAIKENT